MLKLARVAGRALALLGAAAILLGAWLMAGRSTGLETLVIESDVPQPARAIVCITGGLASHGLPTPEGWDRIYTAVQLLADGLAPTIVFSGGGTARVSAVEGWTDLGFGDFELRYLRDKAKREVDFVVVRDLKPWFLVEVKRSDTTLSPALAHFQAQTRAAHAFQVVMDLPFQPVDAFAQARPCVVPARTLLSQLL